MPRALPNIETFQLTAEEVAEMFCQEEIQEKLGLMTYRLANINSKAREALLEAIIKENNVEGGWFYWFCLPGCMPDSDAFGPFATHADALTDARRYIGGNKNERNRL